MKLLGNSPTVRILDLFLGQVEFDYGIADIVRKTNCHRDTVCKVLDELIEIKAVILTRRLSKFQLYKLDSNNPQVKKLSKLYDSLNDEGEEGEKKCIN